MEDVWYYFWTILGLIFGSVIVGVWVFVMVGIFTVNVTSSRAECEAQNPGSTCEIRWEPSK